MRLMALMFVLLFSFLHSVQTLKQRLSVLSEIGCSSLRSCMGGGRELASLLKGTPFIQQSRLFIKLTMKDIVSLFSFVQQVDDRECVQPLV